MDEATISHSGPLVAPFPWFGGKRRIAAEVWARLGDPVNYVEPFFGSGAVLLARPAPGRVETINDKDRMVSNFWRAVRADPEGVAAWADWPVNEADLHARHWWLLTEGAARLGRIEGDPDFHDAKVAGWWAWGACAWIGHGWCSGEGPWRWDAEAGAWNKMPQKRGNTGQVLNRQLPHVGDAGQVLNRQLPHVGDAGQTRSKFIRNWIVALEERLRNVRVCCGDWSRVCGPSVTHRHGVTGVFLDPPYSQAAGRKGNLYATDCLEVAAVARKWAIEEGQNPKMRIVFAGYDGEHDFPPDWTSLRWKANGGYGSQGNGTGRANAGRETLWFSPACLKVEDGAVPELEEALDE